MRIIIGADVMVGDNYEEHFNFENPFSSELKQIWENHDYRIFNIEGPITSTSIENAKSGPNLKMSKNKFKLIKYLNPSVVTLANNHIFDFGESGVSDTVSLLENEKIPFIGLKGNSNFQEFSILKKDKIKVGIYTVCENEFLTNEKGDFGAVGFDYTTVAQTLNRIKNEVDHLILIYHGGKEHYQYPTPQMKKRMQMLIDCGADFIVAQHSHCIGVEELYKGKTILYGQGNFIFPYLYKNEDDLWNRSFLVSLNITEIIVASYIPIKQNFYDVRLMTSSEREKEFTLFEKRNKISQSDEVLKEIFSTEMKKETIFRMYTLFGYTRLESRLDRHLCRSFFLKRRIKRADIYAILNMFKCEPHHECTVQILENLKKNHKFK